MNIDYLAPLTPLKDSLEVPARIALHTRVRWNALELDAKLAGGADPEESDELALRAEQLADPRKREQIARSIDGLLEFADRGSSVRLPTTRAPIARGRVQGSRDQLRLLAEKLQTDGPHPVRGLAIANLLLEDGRGQLYAHELCGENLEPVVEAVLSALDPASSPRVPVAGATAGDTRATSRARRR